MFTSKLLTRAIVCSLLLAIFPGCTTTRSVDLTSPRDMVESIRVEDTVEVERTDGTRLRFDITEISEDGIRGDGVYIPYPDIRDISVVRGSPLRTGLLVGLGLAVLFALEQNADCGILEWDETCD